LLTNQYTLLVLGMALLGIAAGAILEYGRANLQTHRPAVAPRGWLGGAAMMLAHTLV
jgi:hypothetical protein